MGIKKKCRELNKAKNRFLNWLNDRKADNIDIFIGSDVKNEWDYYRHVSAFVGNNLYTVVFMMWDSTVKIRYSDEDNEYDNMTIDEFYNLLW